MIATVTLNPSLDEWMQLPALRAGHLNRASGFARYPGGKGINVSRVIHELGGRTRAFGFAGGEDGLILRELMNRLAIPHEFATVSGATRNNYKIRTTHPRALTEINTAGPTISSRHLHMLARRLFHYRPSPRSVVLSGSLPPGVPATIYRDWIRHLHRAHIPAILDTSGTALRYGIAARPWLIKPNRDEFEELTGSYLRTIPRLAQAARQFLRRGLAHVIISLGKDGALLAAQALAKVWRARPPAIQSDSAVGAGDALVGGFVVGWAMGQPLLEAFRLGVACGTATAMSPGTELCHRSEVRRLLSSITLECVT